MIPVKQIEKNYTDTDLLKEYQSFGKQEILAQLYLRYTDLVYGTSIKYLKDQETAKDAVIAIYEELVNKLQTNSVDNFKSWLYVVTKNHCLMQLRKEKRTLTVDLSDSIMQTEDFTHLDSVLEKEKDLQRLEKCMETLNDEQKKTVELFYLENRCYNEIAALTNIEWNKVRSLIQNGRRNLKNCMEQYE